MNTRTREMRRMYESGKSLSDIADSFGISRQRVQQIFAANNIARRPRGASRKPAITEKQRRLVVQRYLNGWRRPDIANDMGLTQQAVRTILREALTDEQVSERNREQASQRNVQNRTWSDWEMVDALQRCAKDIGEAFGVERYAKWRKEQEEEFPSGPLYLTRRPMYAKNFGVASWNEWRKLAGLPVRGRYGEPEDWAQFTFDDMYRALHGVTALVGRFPTIQEYERLRASTDPTPGAIRRRHGSSWGVTREHYNDWVLTQ